MISNIKKTAVTLLIGMSCLVHSQKKDYAIQPVDFTHVHLTDNFWKPKIEVNAEVTIPYILKKCKETGRINNFLRASKTIPGDKLTDFPFDDTDVYKLIEGASYGLQVKKNPVLEKQLDTLIGIIAAAQEPDGYLYTFRTVNAAHPHEWIGDKRWVKDEDLSHELYNAGHLYEAATAHFIATGKRTFLNVAIKNADLLVKDFGQGKLQIYPGHQIVEMGLVKLYRVTKEKKYLDLAKFFLDVRGPGGDSYNQADKKVVDQKEAVGHAVRAAYMYTGMADVAALTGDQQYLNTIDNIWGDVVDKKLYITGGIGATGAGEAFGAAYELPNMSAYAETCAAIGNVYWNLRMFLLHGDSKYIDVLERTLYNGLLSGVSLSGDHFFYPNPLASLGQHQRGEWFSCACCISNITRFLPSVPGYVYAHDHNDLYVNLFMSNTMDVELDAAKVTLTQQTNYPWNGTVALTVDPSKKADFSVHVRIPSWAIGKPVSGDLYSFKDSKSVAIPISVNGKKVDYVIEKGYAVIKRAWVKGDKVTVDFPMPIQKVLANENVKADKDRFALQKGPIVYCLEGFDQADKSVQSIVVDKDAVVTESYKADKLNGILELSTVGSSSSRIENSQELTQSKSVVNAIPYYAWNNRGSNEMEVWIPYETSASNPKPASTIASRSVVSSSSKSKLMLKALNDQYEVANSADKEANYLHWWPKNNTTEFVQYDFDKAYTVSSTKVYWYDDTPWGGCAVPASWQIFYKIGEEWVPVKNTSTYELAKDKYNSVQFEPVTTTALKMVVQLPVDKSAGIHEWMVNQ
ncbi:glycoside hydrolase family 127 protein [Flavobacterium sp. 5]|uniref:glycoside hydrolase family 127 protein n=1 Tax=Flavobacterium sp. 5 TaxID=2035199 RepID=UPI000C2B53C5|nr:glycoside hydrolase family 127 protein [Flavobacterium sp. 5]PKB18990.1 hypothetical protein CLU82_4294 [Flavobacterium sp. 5]